MPYVSSNYKTNAAAPYGQWVCTRTSSLGPYAAEPDDNSGSPNFCGQCVSFVTTVCPTIPVATREWKQGKLVKGDTTILAGTAIATFDADGKYKGHAAIYENQTAAGLNVVDQWVTGKGKPVGARTLRFGGRGVSNNGDLFYVID
jgi:hypothetical protein